MLGLQESHREKDEFGLDDFRLSLLHHQGTSAIGIGLPIDFLHPYACELPVLAEKLQGVDIPTTRASLFMRRGGLEGARPVGPGVLRVFRSLHGLGHDFYLRHTLAPLPMGCSDAVATGVAATNDQHIFAFGADEFVFAEFNAGKHAVLLAQQFEGEMNAVEFTAGDFQIPRGRRSRGDDHSIEPTGKGFIASNCLTIVELDAFLLQQRDATVDDGLVELEVRDAVAEQSASSLILFEDGNHVTHLIERIGCSKSGRTGTNHSHRLSVSFGHARLDIPLAEGCLHDGALVLAIGRRLMVEAVEHTGLLTQCRTDATRKLGERIGARQQPVSLFPVAFIQRVVPLRCFVSQRTSPMAEGNATIHATARLQLTFPGVERLLHLAEVVNPIVNRTVSCLLAVYF